MPDPMSTAPSRTQTERPRFSTSYMDLTQDPNEEFYRYATGNWLKTHPVPQDKAEWGAFRELQDWNFKLLHEILEEAASDTAAAPGSPRRQVGDLFASAMDTERLESLGLAPLSSWLDQIERLRRPEEVPGSLAQLQQVGIPALFATYSEADKKDSAHYALYLAQGGLSLPDREYYLSDTFGEVREKYRSHVMRMFVLSGASEDRAGSAAQAILELETRLAKASRSRTELRDEERNYHPAPVERLKADYAPHQWDRFLSQLEVPSTPYVVVGQPEFFAETSRSLSDVPLQGWKDYLRWQVLHAAAPYLSRAFEEEHFAFFHRTLLGQMEPEPRWQRATRVVDGLLGEALGQLYVERHYPPEASRRMGLLVDDLREVFRERLRRLPWMTPATRERALAKFDRFRAKIGHPLRYRDYSSIRLDRKDYLGNVLRASRFEVLRQTHRVGGPVDREEWGMSPPTVNAYFNPSENEIVFPAGILQPPFFDATMDDAVNYGGIGVVIGHEITHGYDDQGRRYDAEGNLRDWWTEADAEEFKRRAEGLVKLYSSQQALPGLPVNGELTLGENIADFGGVSLAFEALQRRLGAESSKHMPIDGLLPEQRFFVAYAQIWRQNIREPEIRRRAAIDPHALGRFRGSLPAICHPGFAQAFPRAPGSPPRPHVPEPLW